MVPPLIAQRVSPKSTTCRVYHVLEKLYVRHIFWLQEAVLLSVINEARCALVALTSRCLIMVPLVTSWYTNSRLLIRLWLVLIYWVFEHIGHVTVRGDGPRSFKLWPPLAPRMAHRGWLHHQIDSHVCAGSLTVNTPPTGPLANILVG